MKRHIIVVSFTENGARSVVAKLMYKKQEKLVELYDNKIETSNSIYAVFNYAAQIVDMKFNEAHVNDMFDAKYVQTLQHNLIQTRDINSKVHLFELDDKKIESQVSGRLRKYLYIVVDVNNFNEHLSYHLTQQSACIEVAKLSHIPYNMRNSNKILGTGGHKSDHGYFFIKQKDLMNTKEDFFKEVNYSE